MSLEDLKITVTELNKRYKKEMVKSASKIDYVRKVPYGELALDYITQGGNPLNRVIEQLGAESTGKTTDSLKAMRQFQTFCFNCYTPNAITATWTKDKNDFPELKSCKCSNCKDPKTAIQVYIDVEGTADFDFLDIFEIDKAGVLYMTPEKPSQAIDLVDAFIRESEVGLILLDSIGSMSSDAEVETSAEDIKMNSGARVMNTAVRKWQAALNSNTNNYGRTSPTTLMVINRMYTTLGIYSKNVSQGGGGLKHAKSLSIERRVKEVNKDKEGNVFGITRALKVGKSKVGVPHLKAEDYLSLDRAIPDEYLKTDRAMSYFDFALEFQIITMKGGWIYYQDQKWHGREKAMTALRDSKDLRDAVDALIYPRRE